MRVFALAFLMAAVSASVTSLSYAAPLPPSAQPVDTQAPTGTAPKAGQPAITLQEAVAQTMANSPVLQASAERLNQLRFDANTTRSLLLPNISLQATAATRKDAVADRTIGSLPFGGDDYKLYTAGVHLSQPIAAYGFFQGLKQASIATDIGAKDLEISRRDTTQRVITTYYQTVYSENLVRILQEQERSLREIVNISRRRTALGGKRIDSLQAQTQLALLLPKIVSAKNSLIASTADLAQLMGLENTTSLVIGTTIPELALKDVGGRLNLKEVEIPELESIRLQRERLNAVKATTLGSDLPQLSVDADYGFASYTKSELLDSASKSWQARVVLNIPIFSGLSSISKRRSLISQDVQLESQERNIRNNLSVAQILRRKQLETAETSLTSAQEGARLAKETYEQGRRDYSVGLVDFVQYNKVQTDDFNAATALLQNRFDAIQAYSSYFAASGQDVGILVDLLTQKGKNQ